MKTVNRTEGTIGVKRVLVITVFVFFVVFGVMFLKDYYKQGGFDNNSEDTTSTSETVYLRQISNTSYHKL